MILTEAEYNSLRTVRLALSSGQETAAVTLGGKTIQYQPKDIAALDRLLVGYEMANGIAAARTCAKNVRRR